MWEILPGHSLVAIYALAITAPFVVFYLIYRLVEWWRGF